MMTTPNPALRIVGKDIPASGSAGSEVPVAAGPPPAMGVAVGVAVAVAVAVAVGEAVGVAVGLPVGVAVGLPVGVAVGVAVGLPAIVNVKEVQLIGSAATGLLSGAVGATACCLN